MEVVIAWILSFMVATAEPGRTTFYAEAQETQAEALERYNSIASDLVEVVYDPATEPLFKGPQGRSRTVTVLLAVMLFESGFMKNVDTGKGKFARGDNGKSWCLLQQNVGVGRTAKWNTRHDRSPRFGDNPADIVEGFSGPEMIADRKKCITAGLRGLRVSFASCPGIPLDQKLRVYGSGSCKPGEEINKGSALRMNSALKFWDRSREARVWKDADISKLLLDKKAVQAPVTTVLLEPKPALYVQN